MGALYRTDIKVVNLWKLQNKTIISSEILPATDFKYRLIVLNEN